MVLLRLALQMLPPIFWGLIIFGFEEPYYAITTIICAIIHELGHLIMIPKRIKMRGVLSGFRIKPYHLMSYKERLLSYLGGPMANLLCSVIGTLLIPLRGNHLAAFAVMNLATALSNLMPIEGYDGYGIVLTFLEMRQAGKRAYTIIHAVSNLIVFSLCIFSLCLIDRLGGGYWIFAIFFSFSIQVIGKDLSSQFGRI